ncbi:MAG TPA: hypothetical protein QF905_03155 [Acidimicrobiales bacterium]|nr:hypothetical protein [Acidimicrobiales bacterium]
MGRGRTRAEQRRRARSMAPRRANASPAVLVAIIIGFVVAVVLIVFVALQGGDDTPPVEPGTTVVTATEFAYSPTRIAVDGGATFLLRNEGAVYHDLRIEGIDDFSLEALPDEDATGSIELEVGTYVLFCSVPGHRDAGMVAELQVS